MNIFFVERHPADAAKALCNTHVRKMFLESCNILLWPFKEIGLKLPDTQKGEECKLSHKNHPATIWATDNYTNFMWLVEHTQALSEECYNRYRKKYKTNIYLEFVLSNLHKVREYHFSGLGSLSPFCRCFGDYKEKLAQIENPVEAYREYYRLDKKEFAKWPSVNHIPDWWVEKSEKYVDPNFKNGVYING